MKLLLSAWTRSHKPCQSEAFSLRLTVICWYSAFTVHQAAECAPTVFTVQYYITCVPSHFEAAQTEEYIWHFSQPSISGDYNTWVNAVGNT